MSSFSTRALTLLSSVFGACGLLLVGVAVSTDYWLLMEEGIVLQQNQTMEIKMALHSGLWRVCFVAGLQPESVNIRKYVVKRLDAICILRRRMFSSQKTETKKHMKYLVQFYPKLQTFFEKRRKDRSVSSFLIFVTF